MDIGDRNLKAVLFDLDGTLINSIDHIVACWQHTARSYLGREMTREEIVPTLGRALLEAFEEIAPGRSLEMREVYRQYHREHHDNAVTVVPGTHETLERLKSAGLALGVVTSKGIEAAMEGLNLFDLAPHFDALVTYEDTIRHKPWPDPVLAACLELDTEPAQAVYVGDAVFDVQAGKAAGAYTAAVTWGASTREILSLEGPDCIVDRMEELPPLLTRKAQR